MYIFVAPIESQGPGMVSSQFGLDNDLLKEHLKVPKLWNAYMLEWQIVVILYCPFFILLPITLLFKNYKSNVQFQFLCNANVKIKNQFANICNNHQIIWIFGYICMQILCKLVFAKAMHKSYSKKHCNCCDLTPLHEGSPTPTTCYSLMNELF